MSENETKPTSGRYKWEMSENEKKPNGMSIDDWIKNDICWCVWKECPFTDCFRHMSKRPEGMPFYTAADLKGMHNCPHKDEVIKIERELDEGTDDSER